MADSFAGRFAAVRDRFGPLVWGLDPSGDLPNEWGFGDTAAGLDRFADTVLEAAVGGVGLVKPQSAFYERHTSALCRRRPRRWRPSSGPALSATGLDS